MNVEKRKTGQAGLLPVSTFHSPRTATRQMFNSRLVIRRLYCTATSAASPPSSTSQGILANSAAAKLKKEGVKIGGVRGDGQTPRWYKNIEVIAAPSDITKDNEAQRTTTDKPLYTLRMDNRKMTTPKENVFVVPSELLAKVIAAEWESQDTHIKPTALPITRLATSSLDLIPMYRNEIIENLVNILKTDSACCREEDKGNLHELQDKAFRPMLEWFKEKFGVAPKVSFSFGVIQQPEYLLSAVRDYLSSLDDYHIAALEQITNTAKSLVIALGLVHGKVTVSEAVKAARVEEDFQTDSWYAVARAVPAKI